jgi:DNA-binding transcriptional LysR family regulator
MNPDPRLWRAFVVLNEELHFGRAAERLGVTQPALSQQIARLERQLGVGLFSRSRRHVEPTEAGAAILESARAAVAAGESAAETARAFARGDRGELRLGLSPGVHYLAQGLLAVYSEHHPGVRIRARQDSSGLLAAALAASELDLAIGFCAAPTPGVAIERVRDEPVVVAVATRHRLAHHELVALEDLREERLALVDPGDGPGYNRAVVELCREAGFEPRALEDPRGPMAWETAVRQGACVGLTAKSAAVSAARGVRLLQLRPPRSFPIQLLWSQDRPRTEAASAFAELVRRVGRPAPRSFDQADARNAAPQDRRSMIAPPIASA